MTPSDITSTLSDLERKLEELERDLATAGTAPEVPAPSPMPAPRPASPMAVRPGSPIASRPSPIIPPPASAPLPAPAASAPAAPAPVVPAPDLAELERFRERIEESARRLAAEYAELVARTTAAVTSTPVPGPTPTSWGTPPAAPGIPSTPLPAHGAPAAAVPPPVGPEAMEVRTPAEVPMGADHVVPSPPVADPVVEGAVRLDAGPFSDISTLSQFEQALARIPGAQDVYVTGFEGDRAQIDLEVTGPVPLASALAEVSPIPVTVHAPPPGGTVRLDIDGGPSHGA